MSGAFSKLVESRASMDKAFAEAKGVAKTAFAEACAGVFADHPNLMAFRWSQYTPYFNDGDACTFGVNDVYYKFADTKDEDGDYGDGFVCVYGKDEPGATIRTRVDEIMKTVGSDLLLDMFEDHSQVTVYRDGRIEREEYSHD